MFKDYLHVNNKKIPQTLLGTSPFIGAAQFGHRARLYQLDLYSQPENMAEIIKKSHEMGIRGIQLLPYEPVIHALKLAGNDGFFMDVVGTIRPGHEMEDIEMLSSLKASVMLLHADITDNCKWEELGEYLDIIKNTNSIPGLVTHTPFKTTQSLLESPILNDFEIYLMPVNKLGYLMDTQEFLPDQRSQLRNLVMELDKTIIAKKILAAGILTPEDAFEFLKTLDYVDAVALGIASKKEAEQTFSLLFNE